MSDVFTTIRGNYHLKVAPGNYTVLYSSVGYEKTERKVTLRADEIVKLVVNFYIGMIRGMITRILWAFSALLGASLPLTGYYIRIRCLARKKKH